MSYGVTTVRFGSDMGPNVYLGLIYILSYFQTTGHAIRSLYDITK